MYINVDKLQCFNAYPMYVEPEIVGKIVKRQPFVIHAPLTTPVIQFRFRLNEMQANTHKTTVTTKYR